MLCFVEVIRMLKQGVVVAMLVGFVALTGVAKVRQIVPERPTRDYISAVHTLRQLCGGIEDDLLQCQCAWYYFHEYPHPPSKATQEAVLGRRILHGMFDFGVGFFVDPRRW